MVLMYDAPPCKMPVDPAWRFLLSNVSPPEIRDTAGYDHHWSMRKMDGQGNEDKG